jgi:phosphotransferase system HPr (HPr) family protein
MQTTSIVVHNKVGLHARPAALFVQAAMAHQSRITVVNGEKSGNAKSIISILALGVQQNDKITVNADGPDEMEALTVLTKLIEDNFGEPL